MSLVGDFLKMGQAENLDVIDGKLSVSMSRPWKTGWPPSGR
jgi:hypothetical protein